MTLLDELRAFARARLIPDLDTAWTFASTRIAAIGAALYALLLTDPQAAQTIWAQLPPEVLAVLPDHLVRWVTALLFVLVIFARITRQGPRDAR